MNNLKQIRLVQDWNIIHQVGIDVIVTKYDGTEKKTKTCSGAWLLGGHTAVILLESGCYALERVREA